MSWKQYFAELRRPQKSTATFAKEIFEQKSWFYKTVAGKVLCPETAIVDSEKSDVEQTSETPAKPVLAGKVKAGPLPAKVEIKKKITQSNENVSMSAQHSLENPILNWEEYLQRKSKGVQYITEEGELNVLTPKNVWEVKAEVPVVFVGDTYWLQDASVDDLLGKMIGAMKLDSGEYVRLVYKDDFTDEDYLYSVLNELALLKPLYVICLGAKTSSLLLKKRDRLSKIHGKFFPVKITDHQGKNNTLFEVFPIFHPDFLRINPSMKRTTWIDLQKVMEKLDKLP